MGVAVEQIGDRQGRNKFIYLPKHLHKNYPKWVPPIYAEDRKRFSPRKNLSFAYCDAVQFLARMDGRTAGRIMGIINRRNNELFSERTGRFGFFDAVESQEVANALFDAVESWAAGQGMDKIVGPMGFTDQDPEGLLIEGFEHEPTIETISNPPYLVQLVENAGYSKEVDYVTLTIPIHFPDLYVKILQRVATNGSLTLKEFTRRKELKAYIMPILQLMNETYRGLYGFIPLDKEEMKQLARQFLPLLDPSLVKVVTHHDQVVGFMIAMRNLTDGLRRAKGSLYPFGIFHILSAARSSKQLDFLLAGVHPNKRGKGINVMLSAAIVSSALKAGLTKADSHHILESNYKMRRELERFGGKIYKRHRIYQKQLQRSM